MFINLTRSFFNIFKRYSICDKYINKIENVYSFWVNIDLKILIVFRCRLLSRCGAFYVKLKKTQNIRWPKKVCYKMTIVGRNGRRNGDPRTLKFPWDVIKQRRLHRITETRAQNSYFEMILCIDWFETTLANPRIFTHNKIKFEKRQ